MSGAAPAIEVAAQLGVLGIDPMLFLNSKTEFERTLLLELANAMAKERQRLDRNLAIEIAKAQTGK